MMQRFRRLCRARLWDILVTLLGILSFSVYILHQSRLLKDGDEITMVTAEENSVTGAKRGNGTRMAHQRSSLLQHLQELEVQLTKSRHRLQKSVLAVGEPGVIGRDLPLCRRAFKNRGYFVKVKNPFNNLPDIRSNWTIFICFSYGDGQDAGCWEEGDLSFLRGGQKVNRIPGMRNILWRKDAFCHSTNEARRVPAIRRDPVSPPCWVLPAQFDQFLGVADALGTDTRWIFKSPTPGGTKQMLHPKKDGDFSKIKQYYTTRAIVQQYFPNPLLIRGSPVSIRLYALVTSMSPLRLFLHSEGTVQYRFDYAGEFKKIPDKPISLSTLYNILNKKFGEGTGLQVWEQLQAVVTKVFLIAERFNAPLRNWNLKKSPEKMRSSGRYYQMFSLDVILNSTLHPMVLEVNGQPRLPLNLSISRRIIDDTVSVLLASDIKLAEGLKQDLESLDLNIGYKGFNCGPSHVTCLNSAELEYLLITRQQSLEMGGYRLIYPSTSGQTYTAVIEDLYRFSLKNFLPPSVSDVRRFHLAGEYSPVRFHDLMTALEEIHHSRAKNDTFQLTEQHLHLSSKMSKANVTTKSTVSGHSTHTSEEQLLESFPQIPCSNDEATMPLLAAIYTRPSLGFTPAFDPETTDYYVNVPHHVTSVKVWGVAMSCSCEARAFNKFGTSSPATYTLGVGVNRISLLSVDIRHSLPWVISTYTLHIARSGHPKPNLAKTKTQQLCSLKQNCKLKFLDEEECGLQEEDGSAWGDVDNPTLPRCQSDSNVEGRWLIPCESCLTSEGCDWQQARWQPYACRYQKITFQEAQNCLAGKKLLFVGDSTNRGIMYYLMKRINGSLHQWDKTHQIKSYFNLNHNRTFVTFAYYPQFWLPSDDRPAFGATVHDIVQQSQPLDDGPNTILVVGGVHWLAPQHLKLMEDALKREGLTNISRVMKGLGAGFHQAVDGVHNLSLADQMLLFHHNRELSKFASSLGYGVVDTFSMTMARFTEFRPGTCSCHFHEVVEEGQYLTDAVSHHLDVEEDPEVSPEVFHSNRHDHRDTSYRVLGSINAMYSEMLLSSICSGPTLN